MSVRVRGVTYPDVATCARKLRVDRTTVYGALARGREDYLGLGSGTTGVKGDPPKPVTLFGVWFPSKEGASRALGMDPSYVGNTLKRGGKRARENMLRRVMEYLAKKERENEPLE